MVLGEVRALLEADERVMVWAHVEAPEGDRPGLLSLTTDRCLVHWSAHGQTNATFRWNELTDWELAPREGGAAVLSLAAGSRHVEVRLPLTSDARARTATDVVATVARHAPSDGEVASDVGAERTMPRLAAEPRGLRGQTRRIGVTVAGLLMVLLSIVFASPFVPGPGSLPFLAGLAILAKEYDWARDVQLWVRRKFEQLWIWYRDRRERRRPRQAEVPELDAVRPNDAGIGESEHASEVDLDGPAEAQAT